MSIIITNISENRGLQYGKGRQIYQLKINHTVKCEFEHNFEDGLSTCLIEAADEFDRVEKSEKEALRIYCECPACQHKP